MNFFTSIAKKSTFVLMVTLFLSISVSALTPVIADNHSIVTPEPAISVVYQSLIVTKTNKSIILDWNTVSEFRNNYFEVERSLKWSIGGEYYPRNLNKH